MPNYKRLINTKEAGDLKPYLDYLYPEKEIHNLVFEMMKKGSMFRTPILNEMAKNFKLRNPNHPLPKCLKKSSK